MIYMSIEGGYEGYESVVIFERHRPLTKSEEKKILKRFELAKRIYIRTTRIYHNNQLKPTHLRKDIGPYPNPLQDNWNKILEKEFGFKKVNPYIFYVNTQTNLQLEHFE